MSQFYLISVFPNFSFTCLASLFLERFLFLSPILSLFFFFIICSSLHLINFCGLNHQLKLMSLKLPKMLCSSNLKYTTSTGMPSKNHTCTSKFSKTKLFYLVFTNPSQRGHSANQVIFFFTLFLPS